MRIRALHAFRIHQPHPKLYVYSIVTLRFRSAFTFFFSLCFFFYFFVCVVFWFLFLLLFVPKEVWGKLRQITTLVKYYLMSAWKRGKGARRTRIKYVQCVCIVSHMYKHNIIKHSTFTRFNIHSAHSTHTSTKHIYLSLWLRYSCIISSKTNGKKGAQLLAATARTTATTAAMATTTTLTTNQNQTINE